MSWPQFVELELEPDALGGDAELRAAVAKKLRANVEDLPTVVLRRRAIDARRGRVRFVLQVELVAAEETSELGGAPPREVERPARVVIVGAGPAGLFCAYQLARAGIASVVLERGKKVQPRRRDLKGLNQHGRIDADSNYCFGEGGAGTYSDGKLYTRATKRGSVRDVLELLVGHGAPEAILVDARPHIGSNRLPDVVTAFREHLESVGVEFRFESRVTGIATTGEGSQRRVSGVRCSDGGELEADHVVIATGHSARDVFTLLADLGVLLEPKAFAIGVRIEHPQPLINDIQYGRYAGHPNLPSANYRLAHTDGPEKVFSFCMCPGGFVVPASTAPGELVVNGMSLSKRNSPFANSGLVVGVEPGEVEAAGFAGPLAGVELQATLERRAFEHCGERLAAPATRATDFLKQRGSQDVPKSSYIPGLVPANIEDVLGAVPLGLAGKLRRALLKFERRMRGYASEDAVLIGLESRTSAPVRVPRDPELLTSPNLGGLYPTGEGAGYAGGIVSAALDGVRVADAVAASLAVS